MLTEKQKRYMKEATCRFNFKIGAARSGKTWCDSFVIPHRIRSMPAQGEVVLIGYTVGSLCRNVLDPMRELWGEALVPSTISSESTIRLFGRKCHLLGADKSSAMERLRGSSIVYCYGDEVGTWAQEVFRMLCSRLDKPESVFDGTANPTYPTHWLKQFLDGGHDVYVQEYRMEDNPYLPKGFVENLKREYAGTVWYDRLILGRWTAAEGAIYIDFASHPEKYLRESIDTEGIVRVGVGVDFGGSRSGTAFVASGIYGDGRVAVLQSVRFFGQVDSRALARRFFLFLSALYEKVPMLPIAYCDSAEPILIRTLKTAAAEEGIAVRIKPARKGAINDRIKRVLVMMADGKFVISEEAKSVKEALLGAVWADSYRDVRLDNGSSDIDSLDAMEYSLGM